MTVVINPTKLNRYALKRIAVFSSDEWLANATKKYRNVFDSVELDYVRCELSFYNKVQGNEEWSCKVTFRCYRLLESERKEICILENDVQVKPSEHVVFVRDGWGNERPGAFWPEGKYVWEVLIDDTVVGETQFLVNYVGLVRNTSNPYFSADSLRFYTGDFEGWKQESRQYMNTFNGKSAQYIWIEFTIRNKVERGWHYELFFNFYDSARNLKGQVIREGSVERGREGYGYAFDAGWGNTKPGSWKSEFYYVDVVFMDTIVASGIFFVTDQDIPGEPSDRFLLQV